MSTGQDGTQVYSFDHALEAASNGFEWLVMMELVDERVPAWARDFEVSHENNCPLSRATGMHYCDAAQKFGLNYHDRIRLGFQPPASACLDGGWSALQDAWSVTLDSAYPSVPAPSISRDDTRAATWL